MEELNSPYFKELSVVWASHWREDMPAHVCSTQKLLLLLHLSQPATLATSSYVAITTQQGTSGVETPGASSSTTTTQTTVNPLHESWNSH